MPLGFKVNSPRMMSDFMLCKWPAPLTAFAKSDSVAQFFDELNEQRRVGRAPCQGSVRIDLS